MVVLSKFPMSLLSNNISPFPNTRNLGVIFDEEFNFQCHIKTIDKSCNYHLHDLKRIRKHLTLDTATVLTNALVSS